MPLLAIAFFVTALLYASVGFGGGSTYSALLALSAPYEDAATGKAVVTLSKGLRDGDGRFFGVLGMDFELQSIRGVPEVHEGDVTDGVAAERYQDWEHEEQAKHLKRRG